MMKFPFSKLIRFLGIQIYLAVCIAQTRLMQRRLQFFHHLLSLIYDIRLFQLSLSIYFSIQILAHIHLRL